MSKFIKHYFSHYANIPAASWLVLFTVFTNSSGNAATIFISLYLLKTLGINNLDAGLVITMVGVGASVGAYIGGHLADYWSPRKISITAMLINGICLFAFAFVHSFQLVLMLALLIGFSNAAFLPANRTMIMQSAPAHSHRQISAIRYMMVNLGVGFGAFIGGLISKFSLSDIFIFNALTLLLSAMFLIFFSTNPQINHDENNSNDKISNHQINIKFLVILMVLLLVTLIYAQLRAAFAIYLHDIYHLNAYKFSNLFLINTLLIALVQVPIINSLHRFREELIIGFGSFFSGLGMIVLILSATFINAIFVTLLWTIGEILFFSTIQAYIYQLASSRNKGKFMGIYQSVYFFAMMIGPIGGAWMYEMGNHTWVWITCFILGCIACGICFWLYSYNQILIPQKDLSIE